MGCCPCFWPRKVVKLQKEEDMNLKHCGSLEATIPQSSPASKVELPSLQNESNAQIQAKTFTFRELATATNNFRSESLIGQGGFGAVYKGELKSIDQVVAVKKLDQMGLQGDKEFLVEVLMLSLLRHPNLVHLIGYCAEGDQRLLVYEYMPLGSLEYHLHDLAPDKEPLDWNTRMMIAAGAAKGLDFLHREADPPVIFRDLKSSNILLGEGFHPKLSDFGLAKFGPTGDKSHVSTRVMGTHGYCAPEYYSSGRLTMKSDIYSFGVVLLELITGRRAMDDSRAHEKWLVAWARLLMNDRKNCLKLADPRLGDRFVESHLKRAVEIASMCTRDNPSSRPAMSDVVLALNYLTTHQYEPNSSKKAQMKSASPKETNSPKETTWMLKDMNREQAVAEAKMWGEAWREKRGQSVQNNFDDGNR